MTRMEGEITVEGFTWDVTIDRPRMARWDLVFLAPPTRYPGFI